MLVIVFRGALLIVQCPVELLWQSEAGLTLVIVFRGPLLKVQCPME